MGEPRKVSVLVVEDEEPLLSLFEKVLAQSGFEPIAATTLETAQTLLAQRTVEILVCDLSVAAGRNFFDFVASVRKQHPEIAILIISGYTPEEIAFRAETLGVMVLDKPFSPPDLIQRISALLGREAA